MDAVEKKDSIIVVGSLESLPEVSGNPYGDGVGFIFLVDKKSGQMSTLKEYRSDREYTGFKEIVPSKNGFNISTYSYGRFTNVPLSTDSGWIGITSISEAGVITGTKQLYAKLGGIDAFHELTIDEDSTLYSAYVLDSNLYVQNHHPITGWNSVIDIREVTAAPITDTSNGMITPFAALPPEFNISGIKKNSTKRGY